MARLELAPQRVIATPSGSPRPASSALPAASDSYDNALAETITGLFKTEVIRRRGPWRNIDDVEFATLRWVHWFNHKRHLGPLGYVPPVEFESAYYRQQQSTAMVAGLM